MISRKGISPVIATVIIIAATIAIAIAVVGWLMGLWGSLAGGVESLQIYPDSYINSTSGVVHLHIKNTGSAAAVIYKVEVAGVGEGTFTETTIEPGEEMDDLRATFSSDAFTAGVTYTVKVYTRAGNVYTAQVIAK